MDDDVTSTCPEVSPISPISGQSSGDGRPTHLWCDISCRHAPTATVHTILSEIVDRIVEIVDGYVVPKYDHEPANEYGNTKGWKALTEKKNPSWRAVSW